jgi:hypothetical protein
MHELSDPYFDPVAENPSPGAYFQDNTKHPGKHLDSSFAQQILSTSKSNPAVSVGLPLSIPVENFPGVGELYVLVNSMPMQTLKSVWQERMIRTPHLCVHKLIQPSCRIMDFKSNRSTVSSIAIAPTHAGSRTSLVPEFAETTRGLGGQLMSQ